MEYSEKKKDNNPYLVFSCFNCKQLLYSKLSQKTKKCLRCGKIHTISTIKRKGVIINGITNAFNYVKKKQNEIAIENSGSDPKFTAINDFSISREIAQPNENDFKPVLNVEQNEDYSSKFTLLLKKLSKIHKRFPIYSIELLIDEFGIPTSEFIILINNFKARGILVPLANNYFKLNL